MKNSILNLIGLILRQSIGRKSVLDFIDCYKLILNAIPKLKRRESHPFQILIYHRVLPELDPFAIDPITTRNFSKQLELLAANFRVISLEQLLNELDKDEVRPKTLCITFDDGYRDNFEYAFPILQHYHNQPTVMLI